MTLVKNNKQNPIFIVLDQLSDVRNFGAIIRTAYENLGKLIKTKGVSNLHKSTKK